MPESYIPPEELADLRERIRRRAFLVRQSTKLKVKIRESWLTRASNLPGTTSFSQGREWLRGLALEPMDCYLRLMEPLKEEIRLLSRELRGMAWDDARAIGGNSMDLGVIFSSHS